MLSRIAPAGRVRITTLVCVAISLAMGACGGAASRFKSHLDKGQEYYNKGDFVRASVEFRNATQIEPKNTTAVLMSAHVAEKLGKPRAAAGMYQFVVEQSPDNLDAQVSLGRLFALGGAPEQALRVVTPALLKHPNDARLLTVRAAVRAQQNDEVGARADSELALRTIRPMKRRSRCGPAFIARTTTTRAPSNSLPERSHSVRNRRSCEKSWPISTPTPGSRLEPRSNCLRW